jgi:hypothetical protein
VARQVTARSQRPSRSKIMPIMEVEIVISRVPASPGLTTLMLNAGNQLG